MTAIPRRIDKLRWTPAERKIQEAVDEVESMGAHELLTTAVILLAKARGEVADFVDQVSWDKVTPRAGRE